MKNRFRTWYDTTGGRVVMLVLGMVVATVLLPTAVMASTGTNVNISDKSTTTESGNAKVRNNKLGVAVCDTESANLTSTNCARVQAGRLQVGGAVTVAGSVYARPLAPAIPWVGWCHDKVTSLNYLECVIAVPAGKRLTVETVSFSGSIPTGQQLADVHIRVTTGGLENTYQMLLGHQGDRAGSSFYAKADTNARLYADGGSAIFAVGIRSEESGFADLDLRISGFLT